MSLDLSGLSTILVFSFSTTMLLNPAEPELYAELADNQAAGQHREDLGRCPAAVAEAVTGELHQQPVPDGATSNESDADANRERATRRRERWLRSGAKSGRSW